VCIFIVVAVIRFALSIKRDGFCFRWNVVGMIAFAVVLLINGIFSEGYVVNNLIFGFLMALCFLGMFLLFHQCTISSKKLFLNLAFYMFVLSAVLIIELAVDYATIDGLVSNGIINRNLLMFGWGSYNTMGMLLTLCIPSVLYLAYRFKYGMFFTLYSVLIACAIFFSQSRQCIVFGAIIYFVCFALLLYAGHHKIINAFILVAFIATVLTLFFCDFNHFYSNVSLLFANFFDSFGNPNGSGRMTYWKTGIKDFSTSPIFGVGFYGSTIANYGWYGGYYTLFPRMYHNTVVQILASCGFVGFLAYAAHRTQSIISLFKRPTPERIYLAMVLLAFLLLNLVDVYIFTIISTLFYGAAVGILMRTEKL
jgi:O-antigen ligase